MTIHAMTQSFIFNQSIQMQQYFAKDAVYTVDDRFIKYAISLNGTKC